jgi:hypothetical protein
MKNLFALLFVAGTLSFVACGEKKTEESAVVDSAAAVLEDAAAVVDSAAAVVDSAATVVDSLKK